MSRRSSRAPRAFDRPDPRPGHAHAFGNIVLGQAGFLAEKLQVESARPTGYCIGHSRRLAAMSNAKAAPALSAYSLALARAHREWFADVVRNARDHAAALGVGGRPAAWHDAPRGLSGPAIEPDDQPQHASRSWRPPIVAMYRARFDGTLVGSEAAGWRRPEIAADLASLEAPSAPEADYSRTGVVAREDLGGLYLEVTSRQGDGHIVRDPGQIASRLHRGGVEVLSEADRQVAEAIARFRSANPKMDVNWIIPKGWQAAYAAAGISLHRRPSRGQRWRGPEPHNMARGFVALGLAADDVASRRQIARWLVAWELELDAPWARPPATEATMLRAVARATPWVEDHVIGGIIPRRYAS